jgi:gas vesicle protein
MNKKLVVSIILLTLSAALLSACGAAKKEESAATSSKVSMKDGTGKMLSTAKQLRKAADAADDAKMKEIAPKLEEVWSSFEDDVSVNYKDIYKEVENNLDPITAAAKAETIKKDVMLTLDNGLIKALYDLSTKLITVDQIKAGANQMLSTTTEIKKEISAGNEDKVKELGPKLEDSWKTFEDGVQPRSADLYEKIEKNLNPEVAGSQKSPLDKQVLNQLNDGLAQSLNELLQTVK